MGEEKRKCPNCGSSKIRKFGFVITLKKGKKQRFQCYDCGKTFYSKGEINV
jgi:transposase-like protein